jgi:hypothetical protein
VASRAERFFSPIQHFGGVDVGTVLYPVAGQTTLGFLKGDTLSIVAVSGKAVGFVERDHEIHVVAQYRDTLDDGTELALWTVTAFPPLGNWREALAATEGESRRWASGQVELDHTPAFDALEVRGFLAPEKGKLREGLEVTWRYDAKKRLYVATEQRTPRPRLTPRRLRRR